MALYTTDLSNQTPDQTPSGWTSRWVTSGDSVLAKAQTDVFSGNVLLQQTTASSRYGWSWDVPPDGTNVEVLALVRLEAVPNIGFCLYARGAGAAGNETGYMMALETSANLRMRRYVNGTASTVGLAVATSTIIGIGRLVWWRFRVNGDSLKGKVWGFGDPEPATWHLERTDSNITGSGWSGFGSAAVDAVNRLAWCGVATDGDTVPVPTHPTSIKHIQEDFSGDWASNGSAPLKLNARAIVTNFTLAADAEAQGGRRIEYAQTSGSRSPWILDKSYHLINPANQEVLVSFFPTETSGQHPIALLRASGMQAEHASYQAYLSGSSIGIWKNSPSSSTSLGTSDSKGNPITVWWWLRFRVESNQLKARFWRNGETEPATWDLVVTDSDIATGAVGLGRNNTSSSNITYYGYISVASDGGTALGPGESPPGTPVGASYVLVNIIT